MKSLNKFSIYFHPKYTGLKTQILPLIKSLRSRNFSFAVQNKNKSEFVMVLGGDGSCLYAAQQIYPSPLPLLCVGLGRISFLSEIEKHELDLALEKIKKGDYLLEQRALLQVSIQKKGKTRICGVALNDLVLAKQGFSQVIDLKFLNHKIRADGIIVATPTGSTAYNLSAGGKILEPHSQFWAVTPLCAHEQKKQFWTLSQEKPFELEIANARQQQIVLSLDGQREFKVQPGEKILVEKAPYPCIFIRFKKFDLKKRLKEKFSKPR